MIMDTLITKLNSKSLLLGTCAIFLPHILLWLKTADSVAFWSIGRSVGITIIAYIATYLFIPKLKHYTLRSGLKGKDLCKRGSANADKEIPEALGIVCGIVFLMAIILGHLFQNKHDLETLGEYNAALLSICFMVLLGFMDDVVDLPWRYKLILPCIASLPLLVSYDGVTSVVMPKPVRSLLVSFGDATSGNSITTLGSIVQSLLGVDIDIASQGAIVNLGFWYFVYMGLLAIFCTNAINIYAGVNGLETGQAFIIGIAVLFTNIWELYLSGSQSPHLFASTLVMPFLGVSAALLRYNWYPAQVFVGDTFCYFSGMSFAVMGILGHFSKTLLLFFVPQIFNFVYSCPQLFKVYPCPRHRLPTVDPKTGLLQPSQYSYNGRSFDNMTLLCLVLRILGPMNERNLVITLLLIQAISCMCGIIIRYYLSTWVY